MCVCVDQILVLEESVEDVGHLRVEGLLEEVGGGALVLRQVLVEIHACRCVCVCGDARSMMAL